MAYDTFTVTVRTTTATPPGVYTLTVDGYSEYDGTYYQPDSVTFEVLPLAPQINSITPGRGVTGSTVTLSGANLNYAPTVKFDNRLSATITSTSRKRNQGAGSFGPAELLRRAGECHHQRRHFQQCDLHGDCAAVDLKLQPK